MKHKRLICLLLAAALVAALLGGCTAAETAPEPEAEVNPADWLPSEDLNDEGYWAEVKALDYVTLPDYEKLEIPAAEVTATDEQVEQQLDTILASYATPAKITDRAVADGDRVNIDFDGSVDGVPFDGGSSGGMGYEITVGVTNFVDDFIEQIVGHMPGDTFDVEVTFPDDYDKPTLQGKDAVFVTTVNYIYGENLTPELSDQWVADNFGVSYGWLTVAAMRQTLADQLTENSERQYVHDYMMENSTISELPEVMTIHEQRMIAKSIHETAAANSMEVADFLSQSLGVATLEELYESYAEDMNSNIEYFLVCQAVAEQEGLTISEEELADYFLANSGNADYAAYETYFGLPYLKNMLLLDKAMAAVLESSKRA